MKNVIDLGKQGAEKLNDFDVPQVDSLPADMFARLAIIKRFPAQTIEADTADGVKRPVEVRPLLLGNPQVYDLVHGLAPYEPLVYAKQGERVVLGMLSPNYDGKGETRQTSIKVIPLEQPYPLTPDLLPDARMATMLAGAASAEAKGVGGHGGRIADDFEHKATIMGAVSLGDSSVALQHQNHDVRASSSVATGLTNGRLGNLYMAGGNLAEFSGYGQPMIFDKAQLGATDTLYIPDSFLGSEEAFGGHYDGASRIVLGAGMQELLERSGSAITSEIGRLSVAVSAGAGI